MDEKGKKQIKVLTQQGTEIWPNLPGLKELADNWEKKIMEVIKIRSWSEISDSFTGVAEIDNWSKRWFLNGKHHRVDGPAIVTSEGSKVWCSNGMWHREDGPARESVDGDKQWWLNDKPLFRLPPESQPFIILEEFMDEEGDMKIKVLTQGGIRIWPNLPGLKELAENWEKK
jgi:hypothetical protein